MADQLRYRYHWVFCIAAAAVWIAWGWPVFEAFAGTRTIRNAEVSQTWFVPYTVFGLSVFAVMVANLRPAFLWALLGLQAAAVVAMAIIIPWAGMSTFLVITAWQVGMATSPAKAVTWIVLQTLAVVAALAQSLNPDFCWVLTESFALQLVLFLTATAFRREAETSRALVEAQALVATTVRNAERLRISRELHDAWGHELTALGLQLELASHTEPGRANDHVIQAKDMAPNLMAKVRDVVSTLREA